MTKREKAAIEAARVLYKMEPQKALETFRCLPPATAAYLVVNAEEPQDREPPPKELFGLACQRIAAALPQSPARRRALDAAL